MDNQTKGRIVSALVPGPFLLGTRLGDWYERNPHHRFGEGDILILRDRRTAGYGVRPVAVVNRYELREDQFDRRGEYDITMYRDEAGHLLRWVRQNEIPQGIERIASEHEIHFKWNIENHFRKVPVRTVDEALALYASREVERQERAA